MTCTTRQIESADIFWDQDTKAFKTTLEIEV